MKNAFNSILMLTIVGFIVLLAGAIYFGAPLFGWIMAFQRYKPRDGFCLETQFYPNSINQAGFPDSVFGPDREYDSVTVYQFK